MKNNIVKVRFDKYSHQTALAYCVWHYGKQIYLPKKLCWDFGVYGNDLHVWCKIPAWLYKEKLGEEPSEAEYIYHIPKDISAKKIEPHKDLLDD